MPYRVKKLEWNADSEGARANDKTKMLCHSKRPPPNPATFCVRCSVRSVCRLQHWVLVWVRQCVCMFVVCGAGNTPKGADVATWLLPLARGEERTLAWKGRTSTVTPACPCPRPSTSAENQGTKHGTCHSGEPHLHCTAHKAAAQARTSYSS